MIHVLHENEAWLPPLREALAVHGLPYREWFLDEGVVPLADAPPDGVFYNRMSASSHTRGHRYAPELTHLVLHWLEGHGRRVVNGTRALNLEISKVAQYAALERSGIRTPRTVAAVGRERVLQAAKDFGQTPFIVKPNRGGKGLGVELLDSVELLAGLLDAGPSPPIDGTYLIQEYIRSARSRIVRCEFVGGRFLYAVEVDTSEGFELCPAEACRLPGSLRREALFRIVPDFDGHPILERYADFLQHNGVEVAGLELIEDRSGELYTYDVNTNTNYNAEAEASAGLEVGGMRALAAFLGRELGAAGLRRAG